MDAVFPPLLVRVHDRLGVGPGSIRMAERFELLAQVGVVVDLTVEDHPDGAVLVRERLLPRAQIDDAEATVGERGVRIAVQSGFVRPAVRDDVAHPQRTRRRVPVEPVGGDDSGDSTHDQAASPHA